MRLFFRSIKAKFLVLAVLYGFVLFVISRVSLINALTELQTDLTESRLHSDINYIRDLIGQGEWNLRNGYLFHGDTMIGDGTTEHANLEPFLNCEEKTGTFSYTFIKVGDEGLTWTGDKQTGYMQGHFKRAAGSTLGPNGESIVGTYMDKKIADVLDEKGIYVGPANVAGRQILCVYETLNNSVGEVVGAIVVGRGVEELEYQISLSSVNYVMIFLIAIVIMTVVLFSTITPWINAISIMEKHLAIITGGEFPEKDLEVHSSDEIGRMVESINDMTNSLREKEELRHLATTDPLTGLLNRGAIEGALKLYMDGVNAKGTLFMLDLDKFKEVNDTLGHPVGDELLIKTANTLKEIFREQDVIGRLGGDEFVCFAKGFVDKKLLLERAETILKKLTVDYPKEDGSVIHVTVSIGAALYPYNALDYDALYSSADKALYEAKKAGRNCYRFYTEEAEVRI